MPIARYAAWMTVWLAWGCSSSSVPSSTPPPDDASSRCQEAGVGTACTPALPACWTPTWKPPKAPVTGACTEAQVAEDLAKCWGTTFDPSCDVFERDPVNAGCLQCLFSTSDETSYGAVVILPNGSSLTNVPGCMSLFLSDTSATSCGARLQAFDECRNAACSHGCADFAAYSACSKQAGTTFCMNLLEQASCWRRPNLAPCTAYTTFEASFVAMARVFCVSGFGGPPPDAGVPPDGGGQADVANETAADASFEGGP